MKNVIVVNNLTKDYGFNRGVFNVSFSIAKGEVFGFLGPNGAGKSTTVRHLMGFSKPNSGYTSILGMESFNQYNKILKHVGYIPGELALPQGLTGYAFIKHIQDLVGIYNNERLQMLLNLFELTDDILSMPTKHMSLGSKRKLVIVTCFMSDPEILILDEPTSGLDPFMQDVFIDLIKTEKKRGKTMLFSSHLFNEIEQTCDKISIIKDGKIVSTFMTNDLKHNVNKFYQVTFNHLSTYQSFLKEKHKPYSIVDINPKHLGVLIAVNDQDINTLVDSLSLYDIKDFKNDKETLESYFLSFYLEDKDFGGMT